ncbi:MAG TPA: M48 family metallopeptidase [Candidatus Acidoferrum sp.]|nr:M48 family metallopeptidase [Candidatus Acidoferrum sp.]
MRKFRFFCVAMLCCGSLSLRASANAVPAPQPAVGTASLQNSPQTPSSSPTPVPGLPKSEHVEPQRGKTEQYTLSEDRYEKAVAYSRAAYTLYFVSYLVSFAALILLLRSGVAARFRDFAERATGRRWLQAFLFVPLLILTLDFFDLPVRLYWHSLSLRYEQSVQRWGSWFWDWTKEELLSTFFTLVLVLILFAVIRRSPRRWWLYFWFAALPVLLGIIFLNPLVFDPLFHKFEPLDKDHPQLADAIQRLTAHAGVPVARERIFLMRASEKSNEVNAYVTGLGASKRVVIWDTTLEKTSSDESLFIIGHELGHYVLGHVWKAFVFGAIALLVALYIIFRGLHWMLGRWGRAWRLYGLEDWASLAAFLLLLQIVMFFASPVVNGVSRMEEHDADVYGLEVIHGIVPNSEEVAAHAFQVMGEVDLEDPNPPAFITFWLYSHPPLAERLVFAHRYDPWSKGESPKYVKR